MRKKKEGGKGCPFRCTGSAHRSCKKATACTSPWWAGSRRTGSRLPRATCSFCRARWCRCSRYADFRATYGHAGWAALVWRHQGDHSVCQVFVREKRSARKTGAGRLRGRGRDHRVGAQRHHDDQRWGRRVQRRNRLQQCGFEQLHSTSPE